MSREVAFHDWLKQQRRDYGYTQGELARRASCSTVTISRIEEGVLRPSRQLAELIFAGLEIPGAQQAALVRWARTAPLKSRVAYAPPAANPYKGLRAFGEADAADFFGREALSARLLAHLLEAGAPPAELRFLAVVGPSGSGKSSLVHAGLLPALRSAGLPGGLAPLIVACTPGAHPFEELEAALLRAAANPPASLLEQLQADERGLLRAVKRVLPAAGSGLVLVLDQFEELFTLVHEETARALLLNSLLAAASEPRAPIWVVIALRADFYDRPLQYSAGVALLRDRTELVGALAPAELHRAVVGPAGRVGVPLEPELVATIEQDAGDQPGALPLLEYALTELCARRAGQPLTLAAYQALGGLPGALDRRAEETYARLSVPEREEARQLFLRLVTLGDEMADTPRRVRRAELAAAGPDPQALDRVLEVFGASRLLTFDRDRVTHGATVEVAHEALLRAWGRLRRWRETSRGDLQIQRRLQADTGEWLAAGQDAGFLATGAWLSQFAALAARQGAPAALALTADERAFVAAGLAACAQQEEAAQAGQAQRLAAEAHTLLQTGTGRPTLIALLAIRSLRTHYTPQGDTVLQAAAALPCPIRQFAGRAEGTQEVTFSPDGQYILTAGDDRTARLWEVQTGRPVRMFVGHTDQLRSCAFSPDGRYVLTGGVDCTARLWQADTGRAVRQFAGHTGTVQSVAFAPDGRSVLTGSVDGTARLWDAQTGAEVRRFAGQPGAVTGVAFSPDGQRVLLARADGTAWLWYTDYQDEIRALCPRLRRDFTAAERAQYGIADPDPTCAASAPRPE